MTEPRILTAAEIDEIERLYDAATPGRWSEFCESGDWWIAQSDTDGSPGDSIADANDMSADDMIFVINARNEMPALITTVRHERERADEAERLLKALSDHDPITFSDDGWKHWCSICDADLPVDDVDHRNTCPWRQAREYLAQRDGQPAEAEHD